MRIAINSMLLGGTITGVEVSIIELIKALKERSEHQFIIYIPDYSTVNIEPASNLIIKRISIGKSRLARIWWERRNLHLQAKNDSCNIIHCPGYICPANSSIPIVLTVHDCFAVNNPKWCKISNILYYNLTLGRSIHHASSVITPSNYVKNEIVKTFDAAPEKIDVVPFAVPSIFDKTVSKDDIKQSAEHYSLPGKYILWLGNREPKKNIKGVLHSYKKYIDTYSSSHKLVIAGGEGWGEDCLTLIHELDIQDKVIIPGYIDSDDIPAIFKKAELFLFPSLAEGFGFPVLEAMKSEVPVITSNQGAIPEITQNAAVKCKPDSYEEIAGKIDQLLNDRNIRKDYIERGIEQVKKFSWRETAEKTIKIYEKTAKKS